MEGYYHLQPTARADSSQVVPVLAGAGVDDVVVWMLDRREHLVEVTHKHRPSVHDMRPALIFELDGSPQRILDLCIGRFMSHTFLLRPSCRYGTDRLGDRPGVARLF